MCDMNCLECVHGDCINNSPATATERKQSAERDKECNKVIVSDMTRYVHNRPDKEDYEKARNREYEAKRKGRKDRREQKGNNIKNTEIRSWHINTSIMLNTGKKSLQDKEPSMRRTKKSLVREIRSIMRNTKTKLKKHITGGKKNTKSSI